MARDDMFVVMCKVITYLYGCMKKGVKPDETLLRHDGPMLRIERLYWLRIMEEMVQHGLVRGFCLIGTDQTGTVDVVFESPSVTMEGVEFLHGNGTMQRALEGLRGTAGTLLPVLAEAVSGV